MTSEFVVASIQTLQRNRNWADKAIRQVSDEGLRKTLDGETNSIAVIMKHVSGNLQSRWTDFLTTDGEKPWRNRDQEFVDDFPDRRELMDYWNKGWLCFLDALQSIGQQDLQQTILIRGEPHSLPLAIQRSLTHTCYHVGQIILLARHFFDGDQWNTISIPRGQSEEFNQQVWGSRHYVEEPPGESS